MIRKEEELLQYFYYNLTLSPTVPNVKTKFINVNKQFGVNNMFLLFISGLINV